MPKLGFSMEQGTVVQWLKNLGDEVRPGDSVVLIHSEKVEYEVEALSAGRLVRIVAPSGEVCPPGHLLGVVAEDGEDVDSFVHAYRTDLLEEGNRASSSMCAASADVASPGVEVRASPRARRLAEERGVDLARVSPAAPRKRITEDDVIEFLDRQERVAGAPVIARRLPFIGTRRVIAERMLSASQGTAMVALSMPVDMQEAERLREQLGKDVGLLDMVMRATALELRAHNALNSAIRGDWIEIYRSINIGFAVAVEEGLLVPVVRDADDKSLVKIVEERRRLAELARSRKLLPEAFEGGTFTLSSLGSFGVTVFTPILNPPQTAILGIGAVEEVPTVVGGRIEIRPRLTITLVFDHRATDGAPAAAFLKAVRERLERAEL